MAKGFNIKQKTREVIVFRKSIDDEEFKTVKEYEAVGYKIKMYDKKKPVRKERKIKDDMLKYLKDKIDSDLYEELQKNIDKKLNYLKLKWWLENELKTRAENQGKTEYDTIEDLINIAKSEEQRKNEVKKQENIDNQEPKEQEDKSKTTKTK